MHHRLASLATLAILAGFAQPCTAQDFSAIDRIVADVKARTDMESGTAVIVVQGDRIVHEAYSGYADIAARRRIDANTVFYIASTTKPVLALAVLLAEARGDLSRHTTLQQLFPTLTFAGVDSGEITVRQLLTHTSGIDNPALTWSMSYSGLHDRDTRLRMIAASRPGNRTPGEFEYSNLGYNIMAVWFDEYYGRDWRATLKDSVLSPLGMHSSTGYVSEASRLGWPRPEPYSYKVDLGRTPVYLRKSDNTMYSVGLLATAQDTAHFVMSQMNDGRVDGRQALSRAVVESQRERQVEVAGPYFDGYAWGWMTAERDGRQVRLHTGGFPGASALMSFMPDENVGVVVLHNEDGLRANALSSIIEDAVYRIWRGDSAPEIAAHVTPAIEAVEARVAQTAVELAAQAREPGEGTPRLTAPAAHYAGVYSHPLAGRMELTLDDSGRLRLVWGQLEGRLLAHDDTDVGLVDFRPGNQDPLAFELAGGQVRALTFAGMRFAKVR